LICDAVAFFGLLLEADDDLLFVDVDPTLAAPWTLFCDTNAACETPEASRIIVNLPVLVDLPPGITLLEFLLDSLAALCEPAFEPPTPTILSGIEFLGACFKLNNMLGTSDDCDRVADFVGLYVLV